MEVDWVGFWVVIYSRFIFEIIRFLNERLGYQGLFTLIKSLSGSGS